MRTEEVQGVLGEPSAVRDAPGMADRKCFYWKEGDRAIFVEFRRVSGSMRVSHWNGHNLDDRRWWERLRDWVRSRRSPPAARDGTAAS
jgi:hypothetical protein